MARPERSATPRSVRMLAGLLSVLLHLGLLGIIALAGGRLDGFHVDDTPLSQLVFVTTGPGEPRHGVEPAPWTPPAPTIHTEVPDLDVIEPPAAPPPEPAIADNDAQPEPPPEEETATAAALLRILEPEPAVVLPQEQTSTFLRHLERLSEALASTPRTRVDWEQDGRRYEAELVLEPASDGTEPDRAVAEVSAEDRGRRLRTRILLKRLPFSHYAKLIDRWDPMVQLHDDEVVGRMHINSRFNLLYDAHARPKLLGKVSTAAAGFNLDWQGRRQDAKVFLEGIETGAGRIALTGQARAFDEVRRDAKVRVHELASSTRIRFLADGSYTWREVSADGWRSGHPPGRRPVYFLAAPGATVYLEGVVAGRFLVYSPRKIVVEGQLTYARDPRDDPASYDCLGLVSDGDIEIARPGITGPGDLHVHAALFARRSVVVANFEHPRPATLWIFGSIAAGTLTASEPRYATRVQYDWRFEQQRPPGFPSTDRFAAEPWDGQWIEEPGPAEFASY